MPPWALRKQEPKWQKDVIQKWCSVLISMLDYSQITYNESTNNSCGHATFGAPRAFKRQHSASKKEEDHMISTGQWGSAHEWALKHRLTNKDTILFLSDFWILGIVFKFTWATADIRKTCHIENSQPVWPLLRWGFLASGHMGTKHFKLDRMTTGQLAAWILARNSKQKRECKWTSIRGVLYPSLWTNVFMLYDLFSQNPVVWQQHFFWIPKPVKTRQADWGHHHLSAIPAWLPICCLWGLASHVHLTWAIICS